MTADRRAYEAAIATADDDVVQLARDLDEREWVLDDFVPPSATLRCPPTCSDEHEATFDVTPLSTDHILSVRTRLGYYPCWRRDDD